MADPAPAVVHTGPGHRRDRVVALALLVISVATVGLLWIVARNAPSSVQQESVKLVTMDVSADAGCTNFASFWTVDTGVNVPVESIEGLTNCRLSDSGKWFVPVDANDPRLAARSVPTAEQAMASENLALALAEDLAALEDTLPDSLLESLQENYEEENGPVFGHTRRGTLSLAQKRTRYIRVTQAFLLQPNRAVLADYVAWVMERRSNAVAGFETACRADPDFGYLRRACDGIRHEFGIVHVPLLWDLNDPVLIQEYLIDRADDPPIELPRPAAARREEN
ncbi:MAG: hypothetical protein M3Y37_02030 [Chloroflexota bacterium]|nr:hypothetical protein [Chloroflexota bacterium]